jgi:hypothetical protein
VDQVSPKQLSALTPSLKEFVRSNDIMGFWTCSAKEDANLNKPVQMLVTKLLEQRHSDEIKCGPTPHVSRACGVACAMLCKR